MRKIRTVIRILVWWGIFPITGYYFIYGKKDSEKLLSLLEA